MSNLKKLLDLEERLEQLIRPKKLNTIGMVIPPKTQEQVFQEMLTNGKIPPDTTIKDIDWIIIRYVSPPERDSDGKIITPEIRG